MPAIPESGPEREAFWREFLTRGDSSERKFRRIFKHIPDGPRCKLCAAPFSGVGAPLMRMLGRRQAQQTPTMCGSCFDFMTENRGGAEIECSFLFADVRGSTKLAEGMSATSFRGLLDRFYATASGVVFDHDGSVDKFVGDELVAIWFPLMSGETYVTRTIEAAQALLAAMGHGSAAGPWLPIGAGVHAGTAWVGAVGDGARVELTALGDAVNTTARLAAVAGPGEILVSAAAATSAGLDPTLERRSLELKGKELPTDVVVLRA